MTDSGSRDIGAGLLGVLALVSSMVQVFYLPIVFAAVCLVSLVIAIMMSPKYHGLYGVTVAVASVGFVVGVTVAVIMDNPIY